MVGAVFDLQPDLLNSAQKEHLHPSPQMSVCDLEKLEKGTFKSPDRFTSEDPFGGGHVGVSITRGIIEPIPSGTPSYPR